MGFDNMRSNHTRCPNVIFALVMVCFLLTYNWWSLSTQNYELLKQMDDMGDQLKICSEEQGACSIKKNTILEKLKATEELLADSKLTERESVDAIKKLKTELADKTKIAEKGEKELGYCQTELNSLKNVDNSKTTMLASMRLEKEALAAKLNETKEKMKELEHTLKAAKTTVIAKTPKQVADMSSQSLVSPPSKVIPESQDILSRNVPVQEGNHELNKDEDSAMDTAIEEIDNLQEYPKKS